MKSHLQFDFSVDKENKTIVVKREFDAALPWVWKAWTTAELLDQWWGPQPWRAETKTMDFREGGNWLYAMVGPEGERHWARIDYISIMVEKYIKAMDGFCDEQGTLNPAFAQNLWETTFSAQGHLTAVECTLTFDKLEDLEMIISMGFKEGFTVGLNQLETLLQDISKRQ